ncbi:hypothetical protein [Streptomyces sp. NBC_00989]|uniref:hypothetical protein n=1 Tax=Streptomyces sp. NBC_00989 TaxID=2903705 RepID=UPI003865E92E|nr:hypothetical protein OG714_43885 [Streptomyces sp. NBC_00989]
MAELRGWQDDTPAVVPWIDDRPLWPGHPYDTVNLNSKENRDYFTVLVGEATAGA